MDWNRVKLLLVRVNNLVIGIFFRIGEVIVATPNIVFYVALVVAAVVVPFAGWFLLTCLLTWALNRDRVRPRRNAA